MCQNSWMTAELSISTRSYRGQSQEQRRAERRSRLIAAAIDVYGERGYHQATVKAESIGLLEFRGAGAARFRAAIEEAIRTPEGTTIWYLRVIHRIAQKEDVWTLDIQGEEWGEVDFPEDVKRAEALVRGWDEARGAAAA